MVDIDVINPEAGFNKLFAFKKIYKIKVIHPVFIN